MDLIHLAPDLVVGHVGPSLSQGPLPSVIYFALSAEESLSLDPYNQPALYLAERGVRVFALDLPFHGPKLNPAEAIDKWATAFAHGKDPLSPFIEKTIHAIEGLGEKGVLFEEKIGFMGLSRGGLIASLVAGAFPKLKALTAFAPMTELTFAKEFQGLSKGGLEKFNLLENLETLYDKTLRFYIGNRDIRVGTDRCFAFIHHLTETAFKKGIRSPPIELMITPSIGHMGHGTSKEIFEDGADWLGKKLGALK